MNERNYDDLKSLAVDLGADIFGVAHTARIERFIDDEIKTVALKLPYVIGIGIRLQKAVLDTLVDRPNHIYKTHYRQVNKDLDRIAHTLARQIQNRGYQAMPIAASYILDWQKQNAHLSHRHVGLEAGLGFWGRNNLLVHPQFGAAIRLTSILTDMPLKSDAPIPNNCGECLACLMACPAGAIDLNSYDFDKCFSQIREFSRDKNYGPMICGLCQKDCQGRVGGDHDARA
jgi:epoxyqueuosine reductase QueG